MLSSIILTLEKGNLLSLKDSFLRGITFRKKSTLEVKGTFTRDTEQHNGNFDKKHKMSPK